MATEGSICADVLKGEIHVQRIEFDTNVEDESTHASGLHGDGDPVLVEELAASMLDGVPPSVGLEEGLASAVTCFAMDEAADTGKVVDLGPHWKRAGVSKAC